MLVSDRPLWPFILYASLFFIFVLFYACSRGKIQGVFWLQQKELIGLVICFKFKMITMNIDLKAPYSSKNRHFIIQERFNKLIYGINAIIKCGTWQPVKFHLVSCPWNEMIFIELMLPTEYQKYHKNRLIFYPFQKGDINWNFKGCQMPHFMIKFILQCIYQFIKPSFFFIFFFIFYKTKSIFEEYGAFNAHFLLGLNVYICILPSRGANNPLCTNLISKRKF